MWGENWIEQCSEYVSAQRQSWTFEVVSFFSFSFFIYILFFTFCFEDVRFAPGSRKLDIQVSVYFDNLKEEAETFFLLLKSPKAKEGHRSLRKKATVTILVNVISSIRSGDKSFGRIPLKVYVRVRSVRCWKLFFPDVLAIYRTEESAILSLSQLLRSSFRWEISTLQPSPPLSRWTAIRSSAFR